MSRFLYILAFCISYISVSAQGNGCVDDLFKNPTYQCNAPFDPVCACDGKTYFNQCDAINHGGIQNFAWTSGVCNDFEMFIGQVAIDKLIRVFMQFDADGGSVTLRVIDIYGHVMIQFFINSSNNFPIQRDISTVSFPPGIYLIQAYSGKYQKVIKFSAGSL